MNRVCMYLRKSRADLEAEARGDGETLAKHRRTLLKVAKDLNLNIVRIREEIVSGESLIHRPEMLELLREVEAGEYDAVLVMDMDRLGRGDMIDQGTIQRAFKQSRTKIITPRKTYDLDDEWDEEYSEFEQFMARKELKLINRRLQRGRIGSVKDGSYIGTRPPYGYELHEDNKGRTLKPHPDQAPAVKLIFDLYINGKMGSNKIANELNRIGYKTYSGKPWEPSTILFILKNEVYAGRIQWKKVESRKSTDPTKKRESRTRPRSEWIDVEGRHEPLVSMENYQRAQDLLKRKYHVPYQLESGITNPLAGLIRCGKCGASMVYRPYTTQPAHLRCYNSNCDNKSSRFSFVEERILDALEQWLVNYKLDWSKRKESKPDKSLEIREAAVRTLKKELGELENQKSRLFDFLEREIYDEDTFLDRSKNLAERIEKTREAIHSAEQLLIEEQRRTSKKDVSPQIQNVIDLYRKSRDPARKNELLKTIIDYAVYTKEKHQRMKDFSLQLHLRIPQ